MIKSLYIKNFILFEEQKIIFSSGTNGLVGMTGSGKSIIFNAIQFLCGKRSDKSLIHLNSDKFELEMELDVRGISKEILKRIENIVDVDDEIILYRSLDKNGKQKIRVNGVLITLKELNDITSYLIDIHEQNSVDNIFTVNNYLKILDSLIENDKLSDYKKIYKEYKCLKEKLEKKNLLEEDKEENLEILKLKMKQLEKILDVEDEEELIKIKEYIKENDEFIKITNKINEVINNSYNNIGEVVNNLPLEYSEELKNDIAEVYYKLEEISFQEVKEKSKIEDTINSYNIEEITDQISTIKQLKRKYKVNFNELEEIYLKFKKEFNMIQNLNIDIVDLEKKLNEIEKNLSQKSKEITILRKKAALHIEKKLNEDLKFLEMKDAHIKIEITSTDYKSNGVDEVMFKIKTNKGYEYNEISKIASGGEKSRILLILKTVMNDVHAPNVMLLDEIDQGVSSEVAKKISLKIQQISKQMQILIISHTPQVISSIDNLYEVVKITNNEKAYSNVIKLNKEEKINFVNKTIQL